MQLHTDQTRLTLVRDHPESKETRFDYTVGGGSLTSRSPVGRTGACKHLGTQTVQKRARRGGVVPGAGLAASLGTSSAQGSCPPPPSRVPTPRLNQRGRLVLLGAGPAGSPRVRHHLAPEASVLHVDGVASWREPRPPSRRSATTGSAPTPTPWRTTRCASERPRGIREGGKEGGRMQQPEKAVVLGPELGLEMDLGGSSG